MRFKILQLLAPIIIPTFTFAVEPLADRLLSPDAQVRHDAADELRKLPSPVQEQFVPTLMVGMSNENLGIHDDSASLLKELGDNARPKSEIVKPPVAADIAAERQAERDQMLRQLRGSQTDKYKDLKEKLGEEKKQQEEWSHQAPTHDQNDQVRDMLVSGLEDPSPFVRSRSARRITTLQPPALDAIPLLVTMLHDDDVECRGSAAAALGVLGGKDAISELAKLLQREKDPNVRTIAQDSLNRLTAR